MKKEAIDDWISNETEIKTKPFDAIYSGSQKKFVLINKYQLIDSMSLPLILTEEIIRERWEKTDIKTALLCPPFLSINSPSPNTHTRTQSKRNASEWKQ